MTHRRLEDLPVTERALHMEQRIPKVLKNRLHAKRLGYDPLKITEEAKVTRGKVNPSTLTEAESLTVGQASIRSEVRYAEDCLGKALKLFAQADKGYESALKLADNRRPLKEGMKKSENGAWYWPQEASLKDIKKARIKAGVRLLRDLDLDVDYEDLRRIAGSVEDDRRTGFKSRRLA